MPRTGRSIIKFGNYPLTVGIQEREKPLSKLSPHAAFSELI